MWTLKDHQPRARHTKGDFMRSSRALESPVFGELSIEQVSNVKHLHT